MEFKKKYFLKLLEVNKKKKKTIPILLRMRLLGNKNYLSVFSLKRLILLNLASLTGCTIKLHFSNLANLVNFPIFPFKFININDILCFICDREHIVKAINEKKILNKEVKSITQSDINNLSQEEIKNLKFFFKSILHSVKQFMKFLKIPVTNARLSGLDMVLLVHLVYTSFIFKSPNLLGVYISKLVKKNIKSFNFFFNLLSRVLYSLFVFSGLRGLKIQFKGRLGSSLRKKTSIISFGSMPLQTISSSIKYSFNESITIYGVCGIKIWYYY